jgi:ATP/maltotriose-dependent transcriptional regulator MalT
VLTRELPPVARARAHFAAGLIQLVRGRLDDADRHLRGFEELHESTPDLAPGTPGSTYEVAAAGYAALVALCKGDEAAAERADRLSRTRAERHGEPTRMEAELYTTRLLAMRGDAPGCRAAARTCADMARRLDSPAYQEEALLMLAWAEAVLGDREAAGRADETYHRIVESKILLFLPFFLLLRAEAHAVTGRPDRAAALVAEAEEVSADLGDVCRAPRLLALAEQLTAPEARAFREG